MLEHVNREDSIERVVVKGHPLLAIGDEDLYSSIPLAN